MVTRTGLLLRSIAAGTFVALVGPCVLGFVLFVREGGLLVSDLPHELWKWTVLWILPACFSALIGGLAAGFFPKDTNAPHWLVGVVIAVAFILVVVGISPPHGSEWVLLALVAANTQLSGWCAIRVMRLTLAPGP